MSLPSWKQRMGGYEQSPWLPSVWDLYINSTAWPYGQSQPNPAPSLPQYLLPATLLTERESPAGPADRLCTSLCLHLYSCSPYPTLARGRNKLPLGTVAQVGRSISQGYWFHQSGNENVLFSRVCFSCCKMWILFPICLLVVVTTKGDTLLIYSLTQ